MLQPISLYTYVGLTVDLLDIARYQVRNISYFTMKMMHLISYFYPGYLVFRVYCMASII